MNGLHKRNIEWECECNVAHLQDKEICMIFTDSGCYRVFIEVESGSNEIL